MRKLLGSLTVAALLAFPVGAQAQVSVGPTVSLHGDHDFGVGGQVGIPLEQVTEGFGLLGDFIFYFPDGYDFWEINAAATWDIPVEDAPVQPFVSGGLAYANFSADSGVPGFAFDGSEAGLGLGGGIKFDAGNLEPLVGLRFVTPFDSSIEIYGSLPFQLGG